MSTLIILSSTQTNIALVSSAIVWRLFSASITTFSPFQTLTTRYLIQERQSVNPNLPLVAHKHRLRTDENTTFTYYYCCYCYFYFYNH